MLTSDITQTLNLSSLIYVDGNPVTATGLDLLITLNDEKTDTQGAVLIDRAAQKIFIVFRGTSSKQDMLTDIDFIQDKTKIKDEDCRIHNGFLSAYDSIKLKLCCLPFEKWDDYQIFICGHSLGGALATVCAAYLPTTSPIFLITFGSPRVGDKRFVNIVNKKVKQYYRFIHGYDIVTTIPKINYKHAGTEIRLDDKGNEISYFNVFKRIVYWFKGKQKFEATSVKDHFMDNYIRVVTLWLADKKTRV